MSIIRSQWVTGQIVQQYQWTERLLSLSIQVPLQPFKAGQFIRLQLPLTENNTPQKVAKSYSLVNSPAEPIAEIFYNIVPNGKLSTALAQLNVGDSIEVSQPANGFFVLDEVPDVPNLWLIATGTGLGPYVSMLRTPEIWQRFKRIVLVHGVPVRAELAYSALLNELIARYPRQFCYLSCVTREPNPQGLEQRVTQALESGALENHAELTIDPRTTHVMLCGNHAMLDEMKILLAQRGLQRHLRHKPGHITTEQYF